MGVVPKKPLSRLQWYENHVEPWTTNAVAIGSSTTAVTDWSAKTAAARAAYNVQQAALQTARVATKDWNDAVAAMSTGGSAIIDQIRAQAKNVGDSVYSLAEVPPPAAPAPAAQPGTPYKFAVTLQADGSLLLKWKCDNGVGGPVTYQVYRAIGADRSFIGGAGKRKFIDSTIPAGSPSITYTIQATRTTGVGVSGDFLVNFGVSSSGETTVSVVENGRKTAKIAA